MQLYLLPWVDFSCWPFEFKTILRFLKSLLLLTTSQQFIYLRKEQDLIVPKLISIIKLLVQHSQYAHGVDSSYFLSQSKGIKEEEKLRVSLETWLLSFFQSEKQFSQEPCQEFLRDTYDQSLHTKTQKCFIKQSQCWVQHDRLVLNPHCVSTRIPYVPAPATVAI